MNEKFVENFDRRPRSLKHYLEEFQSDPSKDLHAFSEIVRRPHGSLGTFRDQLLVGYESPIPDANTRLLMKASRVGAEQSVRVLDYERVDGLDVFEVLNPWKRPASKEEHDYVVLEAEDKGAHQAMLISVWRDLAQTDPYERVDSSSSFL